MDFPILISDEISDNCIVIVSGIDSAQIQGNVTTQISINVLSKYMLKNQIKHLSIGTISLDLIGIKP